MRELRQTDWQTIRRQLAAGGEQSIWRSLDELSQSEGWHDDLSSEFAEGSSEWDDGVSRRNFLRLMGASLALAGAAVGCDRRPEEKIVPYVNPPEQIVVGKPLYFATALTHNGCARGALVESHEGRPTKIEGNPDHPASLGAADVFMQAAILDLYDADRSQTLTRGGDIGSWGAFLAAMSNRLAARPDGAGVALLTGTISSPTVLDQLAEFAARFPRARLCRHDPMHSELRRLSEVYSFDKADVILSLDSDFLFADPLSLRYARQFMDRRRVRSDQTAMNRLYVVESTPTLTGTMADHRLAIRPSQIHAIAAEIAAGLMGSAKDKSLPAPLAHWTAAVADDLRAAAERGASTLVVAGEWQSAEAISLVRAMNETLGNIGKAVHAVVDLQPTGVLNLGTLSAEMRDHRIDTLLILDSNPAYNGEADVGFAVVLEEFSADQRDGELKNFSAHLGPYSDETAFRCQWHIPLSHCLESWGDAQTPDGIASIVQPLIAPLYDSKSIVEAMEAMLGRPERTAYEAVRAYWMKRPNGNAIAFEDWWTAVLKKGVIERDGPFPATEQAEEGASPANAARISPSPGTPDFGSTELTEVRSTRRGGETGELDLLIRPDPTIHDGAQGNNGWLQELPKPFTKLVWENAALVSPRLAEENGLQDGDVATLRYRGRTIDAPVMILPGQADQAVTIHLGYGRERGGRVAMNQETNQTRGFSAYALRTSDAPWGGSGLTIEKTGRRQQLVTTRSHHGMDPLTARGVLRPEPVATPQDSEAELDLENRRLVRVAAIEEFRKNPNVIRDMGTDSEKKGFSLTLYSPGDKEWDYSGNLKWGMSIDLNSCIGCNACIIACQAENNIPVVGKEQVGKQREMHWIRVDDYYAGSLDNPKIYHQPVPCMQCENAPCELVCPVGATTHSSEGINEMTYNRCIGTRYCSNNCPYKVRRFNFFNYQDDSPSLALQRNPEVTVRSRGVMEKCNYCLQRITRTRIQREKARVEIEDLVRRTETAEERDRLLELRDAQQTEMLDNLQTACQQTCPTQAIVFGDLNDWSSHGGKGSVVRQLKSEPHDYGLLAELTTKPRTTYLGRLRNPNPKLEPEAPAS